MFIPPIASLVNMAAQATVAGVVFAKRGPRLLGVAVGMGFLVDMVSLSLVWSGIPHTLAVVNVGSLLEAILVPLALRACCGFGSRRLAILAPLLSWPIAMVANGGLAAPDRWFAPLEMIWLLGWSIIGLYQSVNRGERPTRLGFVLPAATLLKSAAGILMLFLFSRLVVSEPKTLLVLLNVVNYCSAMATLAIGASACFYPEP